MSNNWQSYNHIYLKDNKERKKYKYEQDILLAYLNEINSPTFIGLESFIEIDRDSILTTEDGECLVYDKERVIIHLPNAPHVNIPLRSSSTSSLSSSSSSSSIDSSSSSSKSSNSSSSSSSSVSSSSSSSVSSSSSSSSSSSVSSSSNSSSISSSSSSIDSSSSSSWDTRQKKEAILFSLNDYPGTINDLPGMNVSSNIWANYLTNNYNFNTVEFMNENAIMENFVNSITATASTMSTGDALVIGFFGHGAYGTNVDHPNPWDFNSPSTNDPTDDPSDPYDQCLAFYDGTLWDDQIRYLIDSLPQGLKITLIIDSCFAGTMTRSLENTNDTNSLIPRNIKINKTIKTMPEESMREILISASEEDKLSWTIDSGTIFTKASMEALSRAGDNATYQEFYDTLLNNNRDGWPFMGTQTPQMTGSTANKNSHMFT